MASASLTSASNYDWLMEYIDEQDEPIADDNVPLLLEEVRRNYDLHELDSPQPVHRVFHDEDESITALNEAISNLEGNGSIRSCASCSKVERVDDVSTFAKGQHLSMPGQYKTKYDPAMKTNKHTYKHHAIVKEVKSTSGMIAEMVLIHFTNRNDKYGIYKTTETFDLKKDEIYHVRYVHPRYEPAKIVERAESMLPENRVCESQFESYNLVSNYCEHFATWCIVGEGESFQVQGYRQKIADGLKQIFGGGSLITKGLLRMLFNSADEIAASMTSAINVPEIVLGGTAAAYLIYCIVMTVLHVKEYRKGHMCHSCLKGKLLDLWLTIGMFGVTSVLTYVLFHFALPILGTAKVPLIIILVMLSIPLQLSVPKVRRSLQSPFEVDRNIITNLSSVNVGDIISFRYYLLEHVAVVTEVNDFDHLVTCVHYSLPSILGTRIIKEETFTLNPSKQTIKLFDCSHLRCKPRREVVDLVRKRVNETKWSLRNRSDHMCYWAKVKATPRGPCVNWNDADILGSSISTTAFILEEDVHLMTDLHLGDVVNCYGVLVGIKSLDHNYGRRFEIVMVVCGIMTIRKRKYVIDQNKDNLKVEIYHPAHCYPMLTRVDRALAMEDTKRNWLTSKGFIMHCIMRHQT